MEVSINFLAVLVAAVAAMAVGWVWYGAIFKKQYMALMGFTPESMAEMKMKPGMAYLLQFIAFLVMGIVLTHVITYGNAFYGISGVGAGVQSGFWMWLGFLMPLSLGVVLWQNKPWKLWFMLTVADLISIVVMGMIIASWL